MFVTVMQIVELVIDGKTRYGQKLEQSRIHIQAC